jgi:hypothetical protein
MAGSISILPAIACRIQLRRPGAAQSSLLTEPRGVALRRMEKRGAGHGPCRTEPPPCKAPFQHARGSVRGRGAASSVAEPPSTQTTSRGRSGLPARIVEGLGWRKSRRSPPDRKTIPNRQIIALSRPTRLPSRMSSDSPVARARWGSRSKERHQRPRAFVATGCPASAGSGYIFIGAMVPAASDAETIKTTCLPLTVTVTR